MEWKLIASIASFAVVGISVAASVLLDRERSGRGRTARGARDRRRGDELVPTLEGAHKEGYDHIVDLGGGARALARATRGRHGSGESAGGWAEDPTVEEMNKSYGKRRLKGRALSRW